MDEDIGAVNQKLARANRNIRGIRSEAVLTNEYLDLMTDTLKIKFEALTNAIKGDSLERLEKTREEAKRQEALANLLATVGENTEKGVEQRKAMIDNQDDQQTSLAALGLLGGSIALALGGLLGVIRGYVDSFRALMGTVRTIGTGISKAFGAVRQAISLGALAVRVRFESINRIFMGFEKVGSRIIGIFRQFAARARAIMSATSALGRASLMAPINAFFSAVRRVQSVFINAGFALSKFGSSIGKKFSGAINLFRNAVKTITGPIRAAASATGRIGKLFGRLVGFLKGIRGVVGSVAGTVGRLFAPLNFIFVGFRTIKGVIEGFKQGGLLGALEGGIKGFFKALVGVPLDFLKSAVAWILDLFGLDRVAEFLRSFNFTGIIESIVSAPFKILDFIKDWVADKVKGIGGIISSLIPDSFKKIFGIDKDSEDNNAEPRGRGRREGRSNNEGESGQSREQLRDRRSHLESEIEQMPKSLRGREAQVATRRREIAEIDRKLEKSDTEKTAVESRGRQRRESRSDIDRPELDEDTEPRGRGRRERRSEISLPEMPGESLQSSQELAMAQEEKYALDVGGRRGGGGGMAVADNSTTNMISQPTINNNPLPNPSRKPDTARDLYYRNPYRNSDY